MPVAMMSTHDECVILATNESKGSCLKICTPQEGVVKQKTVIVDERSKIFTPPVLPSRGLIQGH